MFTKDTELLLHHNSYYNDVHVSLQLFVQKRFVPKLFEESDARDLMIFQKFRVFLYEVSDEIIIPFAHVSCRHWGQ